MISENDTFSSTFTGENLIVMLNVSCATCKICNKQYTGQTTDSFRSKWNKYKSKSRRFDENEKCMQEYLYSHIESEGHNGFLEDLSINLLIKLMPLIPRKEKRFGCIRLKH